MIGKQIAQIWNGTIDEGARHHHQEGVHASWMMSCRGKCLVYHTQKDGNISTTHTALNVDDVEDVILNATHYNVLLGRVDELRQVLLVFGIMRSS